MCRQTKLVINYQTFSNPDLHSAINNPLLRLKFLQCLKSFQKERGERMGGQDIIRGGGPSTLLVKNTNKGGG
ncbi:hypothetical protein D4L85_02460 [Chryseolinea soli]|uniref:Uncharacterized protein n=1 Tax=Chryseolinea soli TaxID=2321403 RepID=A0A385SHW7_9BACT|nr:hypothetical protein D4L85_02460 [Chryseolinea soli]